MHFLEMCCNEQGQQMVPMDKFLSSMPTKEPNDDINVVALAWLMKSNLDHFDGKYKPQTPT